MAEPNVPDAIVKRLRYRSWHRGCKETDLVMGSFAERGLSTLSVEAMERYAALLEEPDWDIWNWLVEKTPTPPHYADLIAALRQYIPETP